MNEIIPRTGLAELYGHTLAARAKMSEAIDAFERAAALMAEADEHAAHAHQGRLYDAAEWDAAEAKRRASTAARIRQTAERAALRRRLDAALVALPTVRLEALVVELEAETRGGAA